MKLENYTKIICDYCGLTEFINQTDIDSSSRRWYVVKESFCPVFAEPTNMVSSKTIKRIAVCVNNDKDFCSIECLQCHCNWIIEKREQTVEEEQLTPEELANIPPIGSNTTPFAILTADPFTTTFTITGNKSEQ